MEKGEEMKDVKVTLSYKDDEGKEVSEVYEDQFIILANRPEGVRFHNKCNLDMLMFASAVLSNKVNGHMSKFIRSADKL